MTKKQKKMLIRILITAAMLVALYIIPVTGWLRLALYLAAYLVIGGILMLIVPDQAKAPTAEGKAAKES